jgi:hypothetical protein
VLLDNTFCVIKRKSGNRKKKSSMTFVIPCRVGDLEASEFQKLECESVLDHVSRLFTGKPFSSLTTTEKVQLSKSFRDDWDISRAQTPEDRVCLEQISTRWKQCAPKFGTKRTLPRGVPRTPTIPLSRYSVVKSQIVKPSTAQERQLQELLERKKQEEHEKVSREIQDYTKFLQQKVLAEIQKRSQSLLLSREEQVELKDFAREIKDHAQELAAVWASHDIFPYPEDWTDWYGNLKELIATKREARSRRGARGKRKHMYIAQESHVEERPSELSYAYRQRALEEKKAYPLRPFRFGRLLNPALEKKRVEEAVQDIEQRHKAFRSDVQKSRAQDTRSFQKMLQYLEEVQSFLEEKSEVVEAKLFSIALMLPEAQKRLQESQQARGRNPAESAEFKRDIVKMQQLAAEQRDVLAEVAHEKSRVVSDQLVLQDILRAQGDEREKKVAAARRRWNDEEQGESQANTRMIRSMQIDQVTKNLAGLAARAEDLERRLKESGPVENAKLRRELELIEENRLKQRAQLAYLEQRKQ